MCEALDQLPSHGGLADSGNPGNKEGRGPCIKQADDVIQFALATVEFPDARKVSQRRDQLLFHVLGEVAVHQIRRESADVQHPVVVHVADDVHRTHGEGEHFVHRSEVAALR